MIMSEVGCTVEVLGWTPWTSWSSCSQSCLVPGGVPGWRHRSRLCPSLRDISCPGEATQEEPCSPPVCPGTAPLLPCPDTWVDEDQEIMTLEQVPSLRETNEQREWRNPGCSETPPCPSRTPRSQHMSNMFGTVLEEGPA
ncbi:hypothetical protein GHT09_005842 [Marmota monax]|uniref:Spondin domain-containing protein n=1 Tax=Marmota monax TaxID=9995 RepID=A0A834QRC8_MARMO|nr:hypothetical protein GHT09_005842 [Marmota monax]